MPPAKGSLTFLRSRERVLIACLSNVWSVLLRDRVGVKTSDVVAVGCLLVTFDNAAGYIVGEIGRLDSSVDSSRED